MLTAALACRAAPSGPGAPAPREASAFNDARVPRPTRAVFATPNYGLTARVPRGLFYCAIPPDWVGSDHGRSFYLRPPTACDTTAGYALSAVAEPVARIDLLYSYNVAEFDFGDGNGARTARADAEVARTHCPRPEPLAGLTLLGRAAVGCRTNEGETVEVMALAGYFLDRPDTSTDGPDAEMGVLLRTTVSRLASDWPAFVAFARSVRQCATEFGADSAGRQKRTFWVGAAPGRPVCPPNSFW